jgi:hypothetical protein
MVLGFGLINLGLGGRVIDRIHGLSLGEKLDGSVAKRLAGDAVYAAVREKVTPLIQQAIRKI